MESLPLIFTLAIVSLGFWNYRLQRQIYKINKEREQDRIKQTKKAYLTASRELAENGTQHKLFIKNSGSCGARNVKVMIDDQSIVDHECFHVHEEKTTIGPNTRIWYGYCHIMNFPIPNSICITWEDDSSEPGIYKSNL